MKTLSRPPELSFDDGEYVIWRPQQSNRIISIGVDVAEGVGQDYTVAQIMDITDPADIFQCAMYASNKVQPWVFAEKLNQIARSWGRPFLCVERNKEGGQVIDSLMNVHNYDNMVNFTMKNDKRNVYQSPGIFCHQNSKYTGIQNLKYFMEQKQSISLYDSTTITEFESFIRRPNKTWGAKPGHNDDRVMSLIWSLIPLEKHIAEIYFEVMEYDDSGKPSVIIDPNQHLANRSFSNLAERTKPISNLMSNRNEFSVFFNPMNSSSDKLPDKYQEMLENNSWEFM
jgi:hypothetical protein